MSNLSSTVELPLLETLHIASPCSVDWNSMTGDERMRFCGHCQQNVFNLSELTRAEAEQLLKERTGRVCVRLFKRADGTVLTADCPVGLARARQRIARLMVVSATVAATLLIGTFSACGYALGIGQRKNTNGQCPGIFTRWLKHEDPNLILVQGGCCPPPIALQPPAPIVAVPTNDPAE